MLGAGSVLAQVEKMKRPVSVGESEERFIGCPSPINLNLNASTPNVFNGDFSAAWLSNYQDQLGYSGANKYYLHTFQWKKTSKCCECSRAVLTVKMKANGAGTSPKSADAGNDEIFVVHNGGIIPGYIVPVYSGSFPFSIGQQATKTFNLSGVALKTMCKEGRLSFGVQDDTMVQSATLSVKGCCLSSGKLSPVDPPHPMPPVDPPRPTTPTNK